MLFRSSIFFKILFFNPFFIISSHPTVQPHFPGLFNSHFYFSLPAPVQHITHTHYTPIPSPHPHTQTQTQPSNKAKPHTQTQTHSKTGPPIKNLGQATDPHRQSTNPRRRFETQATNQKPEQTHSKKIIIGANPFKPIQKTSSPEPPEQTHSKKSSPEQTLECRFEERVKE